MNEKAKKTWLLAKVLFKNGIGKSKMKMKWKVLLGILFCVWLIPVGIGFFGIISALYDGFHGIGQEGLLLEIGLIGAAFLVLFFGIIHLLNIFYFTKDVESLLPLPFTPGQVIGAKFLVALLYEYLTVGLIILPILFVFGFKASMGIIYFLYSSLVFLVLPILPLVLAGILVVILMRFTNLGKNKDLLKVVGGIIAIVFALGLNIGIQYFTNAGMSPEKIQELMMQGNNSLLGMSSGLFPHLQLASKGLLYASTLEGFLLILGFILISCVSYVIFFWVGEKLYFKGVVGLSESRARRRKITAQAFQRQTLRRTAFWSCFSKEVRLLLRTPPYFLNCVMMNVLGPLFLILPIFTNQQEISNIKWDGEPAILGIALAIAVGVVLFIGGTNGIAATALSREGEQIFVSKYLPISYMIQLNAKIASAIYIGFWGIFILIGIGAIFFGFPIIFYFAVMIVGGVALLFSALIGIIIDLYHPKLDWDSEQKAVKQNINVFFQMLIVLVVGGVSIGATIMLRFTLLQAVLGFVFFYSIVSLILWIWLKAIVQKAFDRIEA
ncbi:MAG: hypothetical protein GX962_09795 [Epulopiscium sp.]|nr:hypothetical protein [Candidatus Epulonipiscium sp.]